MAQPAVSNSSFEFIWRQYRIWSATSQKLKKELTTSRILVFTLTILGSFGAILGQYATDEAGIIHKIFVWASAGAVGASGYIGSKLLTNETEKKWLQSRAAAEYCKSNAFLYQLKVEPYNSNEHDNILFNNVQHLIKSLSSIPQATLSAEEELKGIPSPEFSFDNYIHDRILKQAKGYYLAKAAQYRKLLKSASNVAMAMGSLGFLLGSMGSTGIDNHIGVWIAFISTVSASLTSFIAANQYQYLSISFQATGNQLLALWFTGSRIDKCNIEAQNKLISSCEAILASENEAWMTELSKKNKDHKENKTLTAHLESKEN